MHKPKTLLYLLLAPAAARQRPAGRPSCSNHSQQGPRAAGSTHSGGRTRRGQTLPQPQPHTQTPFLTSLPCRFRYGAQRGALPAPNGPQRLPTAPPAPTHRVRPRPGPRRAPSGRRGRLPGRPPGHAQEALPSPAHTRDEGRGESAPAPPPATPRPRGVTSPPLRGRPRPRLRCGAEGAGGAPAPLGLGGAGPLSPSAAPPAHMSCTIRLKSPKRTLKMLCEQG